MAATPSSVRRFRHRPFEKLANTDAAVEAIHDHFRSTAGSFDLLTATSDSARIGPLDFVAVAAAGATIPTPAALWILGPEGQWLTTELLARIPSDADLWSCSGGAVLDLAGLYHLLRRVESQAGSPEDRSSKAMGRTAATWLMAAKRPRLVPVGDRTIRDVLGYRKDDDWWRRWRLELDQELVHHAQHIRRLAAVDDYRAARLSELRVLDIALRAQHP